MPVDEEGFREMELWEHLAELRTRIIRSLVYIVAGAVLVWIFFDWIWAFLWAPLGPVLKANGWEGRILIDTIVEMFALRLQISLIGGLIFAVPFLTFEVWGFVAPGLTRSEQRGFYLAGPLAVFFFLLGLVTAYLLLPAAFNYFAQFLKPSSGPQAVFLPRVAPYVLFLVKMCLAFGLVFELPVVLMFFAWIGLVSAQMLRAQWRIAVVGCAGIAAIATPSADAGTMLLMAAPLIGLYFLSIFLVALVERMRGKRATKEWESSGDRAASTAVAQNGDHAALPEPPAGTVAMDEEDETTGAGTGHWQD